MSLGALIGSAATALGAVLLAVALEAWRRSSSIRRWPEAVGTLEHVAAESHIGRTRVASYKAWHVAVSYHYMVNGRTLHSTRRLLGRDELATEAEARTIADRLASAPSLTVYYDPKEPTFAVLERSGNRGVPLLAGTALAIIVTGFLLALLG